MCIELIKGLYDSQASFPKEEDYYHNAQILIENEGISSQMFYLLNNSGKLQQTPLFFQKFLKENYEKSLVQNLFIKSQLEQILRKLEENRIEVIPLKGVLFAEKYFGYYGARPTSDIDLLIRLEDLEKAIQVAEDLQFFIEEKQITDHFHCSLGKKLKGSMIPLRVEFHWNLVLEKTADLNVEPLWDQAVPLKGSLYVKELSDYHAFYMICLHGWRHNLDSLKYFIDIIQMVHLLQGKLDYDSLFKEAALHKTLNRMTRTLTIVYQRFPHLDKIKYLSYKSKNIYRQYYSDKGVKKYIDFFDYQFLSYDSLRHGLIGISQWLFPTKSELRTQFGDRSTKQMILAVTLKRIKNFIKSIAP
ncbi:MAG: nucleotidyltransferase family protein [Bacillota bacterium]|nr:nucleotidyltransferase family protein [Bacillota bacterium]